MQTQAVPLTLVDVVLPQRRTLHNVILIVLFSLLLGVSAQIAIPLPFTPVPITMQTLMVLLTGMLLGSRLGLMAVLAYLAEGLAGLPVFAGGTSAWSPSSIPGVPVLLGPSVGYLVGFVFAAALVGWLAERGWDRVWWTTALALVLGNGVIYAFGVGWLSTLLGVSTAISAGMLPFLIGDAIKIALAVIALPGGWALVRK
ncbi:MAG: biotin transporter BioY [Anaerolineales bacterium]|nr:biotin transporter BioY [Anaerolineales bacterium]